ncbi:MAG: glycosyltransferase family 2 protein [Hyphomonas sp.]
MSNINILLCTFRRTHVDATIRSLAEQTNLPGSIHLVVADNDDTPSAEARISEVAKEVDFPITYVHAPARNISIARNACLDAADPDADWIALLDDDEIAPPNWLAQLHSRACETEADGVFGYVKAIYDNTTPQWMVDLDIHSTIPLPRGGKVQTGSTGNALLRWAGTSWQGERFELARGKSGGEDTEFFFRLNRLGACFVIAPDAILLEQVPPSRLSTEWLLNRRFRMGQSYVSGAVTRGTRVSLLASAAVKSLYCILRGAVSLKQDQRMYWRLRCALHRGICSGVLGAGQAELYGNHAELALPAKRSREKSHTN